MVRLEAFADYHTHTRHGHGRGTVAENVRAALRAGLSAVAIAEHGPANLFGVGVRDLKVFDRIRAEVRAAAIQYPQIRTLAGVEANIIDPDGRLDVPRSLLDELDIVLAGLHPLVWPASWRASLRWVSVNGAAHYSHRWLRRARALNTEAICNAVERYRIDVVTHPGYRLAIDTPRLARTCARRKTALEINTSHAHTDVPYIRAAAREGCQFVVGSDAHSPERVGDLDTGLRLAERAGLGPEQVRNARPATWQAPPFLPVLNGREIGPQSEVHS